MMILCYVIQEYRLYPFSINALAPNSHTGVRTSTYEFGGNTIQSIAHGYSK